MMALMELCALIGRVGLGYVVDILPKRYAFASCMAMVLTTVVGIVFAGYIFDVTGSYRLAFISFAAVCVIGTVCAILARRPQLPSALT